MAEATDLVAPAALLAPMIADLHAHYPMHLVPQERGSPIESITAAAGRRRFRDIVRAWLVGLASRFGNYPSFDSGPRVTVESLEAGDARVALSVLYSFFDEVDVGEPYGAPPEPGYVDDLLMEMDVVEEDISSHHAGTAAVAHNPAELDAALGAGKVVLVHAVEGGFHLGATPDEVDAAVTRIAGRGVAYVILAHLFFRQIATNAPALPFLSDRAYRFLFPQPDEGLTDLGRAAVRAMVRERVLVDLSHMSKRALASTFALLDELDPGKQVPVLVSHAGYRFGKQEYMLSEESVRAVAARSGVIGLIFAQHQLLDGLPKADAKTFEGSIDAFCAHVDRIAEITGGHRNIGIGSDFDGFVKPTLAGLQTEADMGKLEAALRARYGHATAEAICCGNALRLLRGYWRGATAA